MIKHTFIYFSILFFFIGFPVQTLIAQGALDEISVENQIENSKLIIEGKVIAKESFWNDDYTNIFTKNTIEVYKIFKGENQGQVEIITKGGWVGNLGEEVVPSLQLKINEVGVFMLYPSKTKLLNESSSLRKYNPYSGPQAFYKYDINFNKVNSIFKSYDDIEDNFYNTITSKTKLSYTEIVKKSFSSKLNSRAASSKGLLAIGITGVSPSTITAGTKSVLIITGTDFGLTKGKVHFQDADVQSGQIEALDSQIISWKDTEVQVEVPSDAGTGSIQVEDAGGVKSPFSNLAKITIPYAELNYGVGLSDYQSQHVERGIIGGMEWRMTTAFDANTAAKESFLRAFESWSCTTGINWETGSTTPSNFTARNGTNIIRFANDGEMEAGVLAYCATYPSSCTGIGIGGKTNVYVDELDIVFAPESERNWQYGPALATGGQTDFESVAIHELGHGHQLGHVISPGAIMHYSISNGQNSRVLSQDDIDGGNDVQSRSTATSVCGQDIVTNQSCSLGVEDEILKDGIKIYPNPSNGKFYISNELNINLQKATVYDMSGRLISEFDLSGPSKEKSINLIGISKGIYLLNIYSDHAFVSKKLILE